MRWCRAHRSWSVSDWKKVIFTDESTFQLCPNRKVCVRRLSKEIYLPECVNPQMHSGGGKVTVWGGVSWYGFTNLHLCTRTVDQNYYIHILEENLLPFMENEMPLRGSLLQQDNARPHTAMSTQRWLRNKNINCLEWPPQSPDLNIIENVWKVLKDRAAKRKPGTLQELKDILIAEWRGLSEDFAKKLMESLPRRMIDVIKAKGHHIKG